MSATGIVLRLGLRANAAQFTLLVAVNALRRKPVLIAGWLVGLPVPLMLI